MAEKYFGTNKKYEKPYNGTVEWDNWSSLKSVEWGLRIEDNHRHLSVN